MTKSRHAARRPESGVLVRTFGLTITHGPLEPPVHRAWHQLIYSTRGALAVQSGGSVWVVPPHRALWVPAGQPVRIEWSGTVSLRSLYLRAGRGGPRFDRCHSVNVSPLLRELILRTVACGALHRDDPAQRRLAGVLLDQIDLLPVEPLQLPIPSDPRGERAAAAVRAAPGRRTSAEIARAAGASPRTLERIFERETGMSFGRWSRRAVLVRGLQRLANGEPVSLVATDLGYRSPSAFIAMFRRSLGATPARYFASPGGPRGDA